MNVLINSFCLAVAVGVLALSYFDVKSTRQRAIGLILMIAQLTISPLFGSYPWLMVAQVIHFCTTLTYLEDRFVGILCFSVYTLVTLFINFEENGTIYDVIILLVSILSFIFINKGLPSSKLESQETQTSSQAMVDVSSQMKERTKRKKKPRGQVNPENTRNKRELKNSI